MSKRHLFIAAISACAFASTASAGLLGGGGAVGGTLNGVMSPSGIGIGGQGQGSVNGILTAPRLPKADTEKAKDAANAAAGKAADAAPKGEARASASGNSSASASTANSASANASFSADGSVR